MQCLLNVRSRDILSMVVELVEMIVSNLCKSFTLSQWSVIEVLDFASVVSSVPISIKAFAGFWLLRLSCFSFLFHSQKYLSHFEISTMSMVCWLLATTYNKKEYEIMYSLLVVFLSVSKCISSSGLFPYNVRHGVLLRSFIRFFTSGSIMIYNIMFVDNQPKK